MSSEAERLTEERKVATEAYTENKTHTRYVSKRGVKMIDIQKRTGDKNLYHVVMKKIKSYYKTNDPTEEQVRKYKRKANEFGDDDNKCVYIREDLAYSLIHYINLGVIEADEFKKNLSITNNQSIRIERKIIVIIMKVFAKENMVRQYQILWLPYRVDLCFVDHKLVIEIDDDHPYYRNDEIRHKLIENQGFTFITTNPDPEPDAFSYPDVEIAKICNHIYESFVKLAVILAEKSLKEMFTKEPLNYMSSISKPLK